MRTLLKLQHHRHTAKRLPHHHTSYRGLLLVVVALGLSIVSIQQTSAEIIDVSARIAAPVPTEAPVVTSPVNGSTVSSGNVVVSGTCQIISPAYAVVATRNNQLLGSSVCASDGTFSLTISLVPGANTIVFGSRTITDDSGPDSPPFVINYQQPSANTAGPVQQPVRNSPEPQGSQPQQNTGIAPLQSSLNNLFYVEYVPGQAFNFNFEIIGGIAPYQVSIDWGDGTKSMYSFAAAGNQTVQHSYEKTGFYTITLSITDGSQQAIQTTIAALTFAQASSDSAAVGTTANSSPDIYNNAYIYVWSIYGAVVLLFVVLWLSHGHLIAASTMLNPQTHGSKKIRR